MDTYNDLTAETQTDEDMDSYYLEAERAYYEDEARREMEAEEAEPKARRLHVPCGYGVYYAPRDPRDNRGACTTAEMLEALRRLA